MEEDLCELESILRKEETMKEKYLIRRAGRGGR